MDVNLILFKKNGSQKVIPLPSNVTVIGRRQDCDLRIPITTVSRRHCQLCVNNQSLKIRDLGSRNGTFVNGKRIEEATIKPGDNITIGPLIFALQIDGQPKEFVPPTPAAQKPPLQEKAAATTPEEKESGSFLTVAADEQSDDLPELDLNEDDDSFLAELEDI
jgi:pSer/pThr/pTyr-binding forkhead associated (FHA) protein